MKGEAPAGQRPVNPNQRIVNMAIPRKKVLEKIAGYRKGIDYHLDDLTMTNEQYEELRSRFRKVFEAKWDRSELANYDELREKFAFHMADAAQNLDALAQAYAKPSACDTKCLSERTELFFYDCVPHLMAAAQIYDEIPKLFEEQNGVHDWSSFIDN